METASQQTESDRADAREPARVGEASFGDFVAVCEDVAKAMRRVRRSLRKLAKRFDPVWQRRRARALARSRRNSQFPKKKKRGVRR